MRHVVIILTNFEMREEQALLIKRMIDNYDRPRNPHSESEVKQNYIAVRMITLIGCLDYAMIELRERLEERDLFVRGVKRNFNKANACVIDMHKEVCAMIHRSDGVATRIFSDLRDKNWWSIDEHISLGGIDGAYCVVMSLCRLIEACNASISKRYNYRSVDKLKHVKDMLSVIGAEDKNLDFIIDKAVVVR
jgi:hypothetical protein